MKFILNYFSILFILISTANAVDMSIDTDTKRSMSREKSMSDVETRANDKAYTTTINLALLLVDKIDMACTKQPKSLRDFGLSYSRNGVINLTKKEFLENAASNSLVLKNIGLEDKYLKEYILCLLDAGAILAQASLDFPKMLKENATEKELQFYLSQAVEESRNLHDINIKLLSNKAKQQLENDCRFYNSIDTIMCGNIVLEMTSQNLNQVTYLNHHLFGSSDSIYGISTSFEVALSTNASEETAMKKSSSMSNEMTDKQSISAGKFLPQ